MKFGVYFAYWEREWNADYSIYVKKAADLGFDILEIAAGSLPELSSVELGRLRDTATAAGIELTACIGLPKAWDVSSPDKAVREAGFSALQKIFSAMDIIGAKKIGGITYAYWPYDYNEPFDKKATWERSVQSVHKISDMAACHGITLCLEIVNRFESFLLNTAAEGVAFCEQVGKPNVRLLLDVFHMNIEEDWIGDAIRLAGKKYLGELHMGECNRKVPGKGHMPWNEIGKALTDIQYDGPVVMEPFVREGGTVGKDIKVWRDISEGADDDKIDADIVGALHFLKSCIK